MASTIFTAGKERAAKRPISKTEKIYTDSPRPLARTPQMAPSNFKGVEKCKRALGDFGEAYAYISLA